VVLFSQAFFALIHHVFVRIKIFDTVGLTETERKTLYYQYGKAKKIIKTSLAIEHLRLAALNETILEDTSIN
jgi:hypothetical protein